MSTENLYRMHKQVEFVKQNKSLFEQYSMIKGYPGNTNPIVKEIAKKAREEVDYSSKTNDCDIVRPLYLLYKAIKQNIKI